MTGMSDPVVRPHDALSERAAAILEFEKQWWAYARAWLRVEMAGKALI